MKINKIIIIFLLLSSIFTACVNENIDFDQAQQIELTPIVKVSLLHFKVGQDNFIDPITNLDTPLRTDFTDINTFNNAISDTNITRVLLKIAIENTFNKAFSIEYHLLDENAVELDVLQFNINENSINSNEYEYLFGTPEFDNLIKTTRIVVVVDQLTNPNLTDATMFLDFRSAVDIHLNISDD